MNNFIYESNNAKYLPIKQIVNTFIPNEQFEGLTKNINSILMGPRGSGKTTLLKMLTPEALHFWKGQTANKLKNRIPFFAIYIPTDVHWKKQLDEIQSRLGDNTNYWKLLSRSIVLINIQIAMLKTFNAILNYKDNLHGNELEQEGYVCTELIHIWELTKPISPTFDALEISLLKRLDEIFSVTKTIIKQTELSYPKGVLLDYPSFMEKDFNTLVPLSCKIFEKILKKDSAFIERPFYWALCFDELEIAPQWLLEELLYYLRAPIPDFIIKITTTPIISLQKFKNVIDAKFPDDYHIIRTWVYNDKEAKKWGKFCTRLIKSQIKNKFDLDIDPNELFGNEKPYRILIPEFNNEIVSNYAYRKGGVYWHLFKKLAHIDKDFKNFLDHKKISHENPEPLNKQQEDKIHRKMLPLALFRFQLKKTNAKRSRKVIPTYYGLPFLYELCDGNPRSLIELFDELFLKISKNDKGMPKGLPIVTQSQIVYNYSELSFNIITEHPEANLLNKNTIISMHNLISLIGEYFHEQMFNSNFSIDPAGAFIVDENISQNILNLLELALFLRVIIYLDPKEGIRYKGLVDKTFRLSYIFHPNFILPKRQYKAINLSTIIKRSVKFKDQLDLFIKDENNKL